MQIERQRTYKDAHIQWEKVVKELNLTYEHQSWFSKNLDLSISACRLYDSLSHDFKSIGMGKGTALEPILGAEFESLEHYFYGTQEHNSKKLYIADIRNQSSVLYSDPAFDELYRKEHNIKLYVDRFKNYVTKEDFFYPAFLNDVEFVDPSISLGSHAYNYSSDSGFASGTTFKEAFLHSLNELIERDTVSKFILKYGMNFNIDELSASLVELKSLPKRLVDIFLAIKDTTKSNIELVYIKNKFNIPTFLTIINYKGKMLLPIYGAGTSLSPAYAMERALTEAFQLFCVKEYKDSIDLSRKLSYMVTKVPKLKELINFSYITKLKNKSFIDTEDKYSSVDYLLEKEINLLRKDNIDIYYRHVIDMSGFYFMQTLIPAFERFNMILEGQIVLPRSDQD